jgi:hypothetical protein
MAVFGIDKLLIDAFKHVLTELVEIVCFELREGALPNRRENGLSLRAANPLEEIIFDKVLDALFL